MLVLLRLMVITVRESVACGCNRRLRHSVRSMLILLMIPPPVALCAPPFPTSRGDPHKKINQILKRTNGGPRVANSCRKVDLGIAQAAALRPRRMMMKCRREKVDQDLFRRGRLHAALHHGRRHHGRRGAAVLSV